MFVHQYICPYLQETQHHPTTLYSPCSQPLHSMTWNVQPCYKYLLTGHICSLSDNNVPCLNNRQPATAATVIVKKSSTLCMSSDSCVHLVRLVECLSLLPVARSSFVNSTLYQLSSGIATLTVTLAPAASDNGYRQGCSQSTSAFSASGTFSRNALCKSTTYITFGYQDTQLHLAG